ncbi:hypothetical protein [Streptomyces sp. MMBL 11-3]|uniref:hypothetical protein n=1 Tax=Streptomyces sp. MMBL 11-3 TaxID=3382639 RepID=UPI0039B4311F
MRYACLTSGTWTLRRDGRTVATGLLPGGRETPGPGTYEVSGTVHVRSAPAGVDLRGTVRTTLALTDPEPVATHRIEVDRRTLRPHASATLTYTVARDSDAGHGSAVGACSSVVSKLGYWMPRGQSLHTGGMPAGPTVTCRASDARTY